MSRRVLSSSAFCHTKHVNSSSRWRVLASARFCSTLALCLWIGGLALIGVSAPAIFQLNRLLGPRAVAAMLERFSPLTVVCGVVLLACWIIESRLVKSSTRSRAFKFQGACIFAMLLLGSYLALIAAPRIVQLQPPLQQTILKTESVQNNGVQSINPTEVTIRAGQFASPQARQEFRKLHGIYGGLTSLVVLLGIVVLAIYAARSVDKLRPFSEPSNE